MITIDTGVGVAVADFALAAVYVNVGGPHPPILSERLRLRAGVRPRLLGRDTMSPPGAPRALVCLAQTPEEAGFARLVADKINVLVHEDQIKRMILVAPPLFLGHLRTHLSPRTCQSIAAEIAENLVRLTPAEIALHLIRGP